MVKSYAVTGNVSSRLKSCPGSFPFTPEQRVTAIRPEHELSAIVGGIHYDGVIGNAQISQVILAKLPGGITSHL